LILIRRPSTPFPAPETTTSFSSRFRLPREQSYAIVQGLQAIQDREMEAPVGRFTAPTQDAIRQALRKANRRNSGFHAGRSWSGKVAEKLPNTKNRGMIFLG
jgi:hypothetical protein